MATADFKSFKADGSLQFDANAAVFVLVRVTGVYTVAPNQFNYTQATGSMALVPFDAGSHEISAFAATVYAHARCGTMQISGAWYDMYITNAPVGTGFGVYTYKPANEITTSTGFGLHLYNGAGTLTYASDQRPMVVAAMVSGVGTTVTLPAGRNYASMCQAFAGTASQIYDGTYEAYTTPKNEPWGRYYYGVDSTYMYGVVWTDALNAQLVSVPYGGNGIQVNEYFTTQYGAGNVTAYYVPASTNPCYDVPLNNVLFIDTTGYA